MRYDHGSIAILTKFILYNPNRSGGGDRHSGNCSQSQKKKQFVPFK